MRYMIKLCYYLKILSFYILIQIKAYLNNLTNSMTHAKHKWCGYLHKRISAKKRTYLISALRLIVCRRELGS